LNPDVAPQSRAPFGLRFCNTSLAESNAMISAHDREILSRLPEWNPTGDIAAQRR
jgi:hypothetical protein